MFGRTAFATLGIPLAAIFLAGCAPSFSPDTYSANATQQANKVDQGVVVGVRAVQINVDTTLGSATGAAAGGIAGSQVGGGAASALGALGGSVAGGVVGSVVSHAAGDTDGFEYIVRKPNGDLLSVTQRDPEPLGIGAHVLIIEGPQARIVPDYTVPIVVQARHPDPPKAPEGESHPAAAASSNGPATPSSAITTSPLPPPDTSPEGGKQPPTAGGAPPTTEGGASESTPAAPPGSI
jgi:outer membrane lipoprotein SlyB